VEIENVMHYFWESSFLGPFVFLSASLEFCELCNVVDRKLSNCLADRMMQNPFDVSDDTLAFRMREIAALLPEVFERCSRSSGMGDRFVKDRAVNLEQFCEVLLRRALFIEKL